MVTDVPALPVHNGSGGDSGADDAAFAALVAVVARCCLCLITYLEAVMREHARHALARDLAASFGTVGSPIGKPWHTSWEAAKSEMQRDHEVAGGLHEAERRALWAAHVAHLRATSGDACAQDSSSVRVDVSDLGLTMDDISGPLGGL